jgi:hypothetical protein
MLVFRILLALTGLGLFGLLGAYLVTRNQSYLRYALWVSAAFLMLALVFFAGLFVSRL